MNKNLMFLIGIPALAGVGAGYFFSVKAEFIRSGKKIRGNDGMVKGHYTARFYDVIGRDLKIIEETALTPESLMEYHKEVKVLGRKFAIMAEYVQEKGYKLVIRKMLPNGSKVVSETSILFQNLE